MLDEQNNDTIDELSSFKLAQDITIDLFDFWNGVKFDFVKIKTEIVWRPGKYKRLP